MLVGGEPFGNLYLTEKAGGEEFTQEDELTVGMLAELAGVAIDHARRYSGLEFRHRELRRTVDAFDATLQIARALGGETDLEAILALVAERGRALVSARTLVIEQEQAGEMVIAAAAGVQPEGLVGQRVDAHDSVAAAALRTGRTLRLEDGPNRARFDRVGLGRLGTSASGGLVVPLLFRGQRHGVLIALDRLQDGPVFTAEDERLLEAFATTAATAIATAVTVEAERHRQRLAAEQERARWARELHDETLQHLAELRLGLVAQLRHADSGPLTETVREAVAQLEADIGSLRSLITDLRPAALHEVGAEAAIKAAAALDDPLQIFSTEHLVAAVHVWTCSAAPIHDPFTGELIGVIDTADLRTAHPHTLSVAVLGARAAEARLRIRLLEAAARWRDEWKAAIARGRTASALLDSYGRVIATHAADGLPSELDLKDASDVAVTLPNGRIGELQPLEGGGAILWLCPRSSARASRLRLRLLGRATSAQLGSARPERALRSLELLAVLAMHPEGLTAEQLALAMYGERGKTVTIRAQVHRVRTRLGERTLDTQPYRLLTPVDGDWLEVQRLVSAGWPREALRAYRGPLLPASDAPEIVEARGLLEESLRRSILTTADPELLCSWLAHSAGADDLAAARTLIAVLPPRQRRLPSRDGYERNVSAPDQGQAIVKARCVYVLERGTAKIRRKCAIGRDCERVSTAVRRVAGLAGRRVKPVGAAAGCA